MARIKKEHIVSNEEKQTADLQIKETQKQIDYDTKDFTIEILVDKFKKKDFFIPSYQRNFIWQPKNKTLFLESIFLGLPIPFMFFADCDNGKQEIIDGAQRMQTLVEFHNNKLQLSGLKKLTKLNGFYFKDLSDAQQRKFLNKTLRIIVLKEDMPTAARQDLFYRINTTGMKANDSEVRRGSYPGPFTDFIEKCSKDEVFVTLCPMSEDRVKKHERFEFVLRFFAYLNSYENFGHTVNEFLDEYLINNLVDFDENAFYDEIILSKDALGISGNLNAKKITDICDKHRIRYRLATPGESLERVKRERNSLAHGDVSFSDCARDLTINDLENIKDEVVLFLTGILAGMKDYYDQKSYKLPAT